MSTPSKVKGTVDRSPTKSASSDFWPIEGKDGFLISIGPRVSCPISEARTVRSSRGRFSLKRQWDQFLCKVPSVSLKHTGCCR